MAGSPPTQALFQPPFEERLASCLHSLAGCLEAAAIVLLDHASPARIMAPRARFWCGTQPSETWSRDQFCALYAAADTPEALDSSLRALLGSGFAEGAVLLVPLQIRPPLWSGGDTLLCIAAPQHPPPEQWKTDLEHALSEDRHAMLAETALVAMETAMDPIELSDGTVRLFWANNAWERHTGYSTQENVGRYLSFLRDPKAPLHDPAFYRFTQEVLDTDGRWIGFVGSLSKDGRRLPQEISVSRFHRSGHPFAGNLSIRRDLSIRAQREEALALAYLELRQVLAALQQGVAVVRDRLLIWVNPAMAALVDRHGEGLIQQPFRLLVHPEDHANIPAEGSQGQVELRLVRPDGAVRFTEVSIAGTVNFEGGLSQILLFRDVTDQKVALERQAHAGRLQALGSLAASIGHEINNPLGFVIGNLATLLESEAPGEKKEALREALAGARRIQASVAELRAFSRLEAPAERGAATPQPNLPIELGAALGAALNLTANELRHRTQIQREETQNLRILGQEGPLVQAFVNLLLNAAQALDPRKVAQNRLRIGCRTEDGPEGREVVVELEDNGSGIAPEHLDRVFEPFFTTRASEGGQGLGLSISRRILEGMGGKLTLQSRYGQGTRVSLRLPAAPEPVAPAAPPAPVVPTKARILVIDDEAAIARSIKRMLRDHDVEMIHEGTGALERLRLDPSPDLVICDLMMPGLTGPELYEAVGMLRPDLQGRFMFVTGGAFTEDTVRFLASMAGRVLEKPFGPAELRAAVGAHLAQLTRGGSAAQA